MTSLQSWTLKPYRHIARNSRRFSKLKISDESPIEMKSACTEEPDMELEAEFDFDPDSKNQSMLTVNAAVFDVNLHICDNLVRILYDEEHVELNGLANIWYSVTDLIKIMRSAGINIFPREDSSKYVSVTEKVRDIMAVVVGA